MKFKSTLSAETNLLPTIGPRLLLALICFALTIGAAQAQLKGKVFRDFNGNGTRDSSATFLEIGVSGVLVTVTDGTSTTTTNTGAFGDYSFPNSGVTASGKEVRVVLSNFPAGVFPGA